MGNSFENRRRTGLHYYAKWTLMCRTGHDLDPLCCQTPNIICIKCGWSEVMISALTIPAKSQKQYKWHENVILRIELVTSIFNIQSKIRTSVFITKIYVTCRVKGRLLMKLARQLPTEFDPVITSSLIVTSWTLTPTLFCLSFDKKNSSLQKAFSGFW